VFSDVILISEMITLISMENPNERIRYLIIRHLKGELTIHEQLELQEWVNASNDHREIFDQLSDPDRLKDELREYFEAQANIWDKIDARIKTPSYIEGPAESLSPAIHPIRRHLRPYIAAASLLVVIVTGYFWLNPRHTPIGSRPAPVAAREDIAPGGDKAILTLGNDSTIELENVANGHLAVQGVSQISKNKNSLSYTVAASGQGKTTEAVVYNTLTTPRTSQYSVILPDGTKVWLNDSTRLYYPTFFCGAYREVALTGEAYFEVAKDKTKPFKVNVDNKSEVEVLGTHFNIDSYADDGGIKTTLLEGSVKVTQRPGQVKPASAILRPGEQSTIMANAAGVSVNPHVDVDKIMAWKNGLFNFEQADLKTIMAQLGRWYDIDVKYEGNIAARTFRGKITRDLKLSQVIKGLEDVGLKFRIEGRTLIVMD